MRPDTRSFSFTWLKGGERLENDDDERTDGGEGVNRIRTRASSRDSMIDPNQENLINLMREEEVGFHRHRGLGSSTSNSVGRLKRLRVSILKNATSTTNRQREYASIEDDQEDDEGQTQTAPTTSTNQIQGQSTMSIGKKFNKTVQDVRNTLGNLSQRFRRSGRRRYRLTSPKTPQGTPTRRILGRTPTKLYSPFGIESPKKRPTRTPRKKETLKVHPGSSHNSPSTRNGGGVTGTPKMSLRSAVGPLTSVDPFQCYSPANNFKRDLMDINLGFKDMQVISQGVVSRLAFRPNSNPLTQ